MKENKNKKKKIVSAIGNALMLISLVFIIKYICDEDISFDFLIYKKNIIALLVLTLLSSISVICLALAWRNNIYVYNIKGKISCKEAIWVCTKSNLARYIPGNIAHYASRNIIGTEYGLSQKSMIAASLMEVVFTILVGIIIIFIFMFPDVYMLMNDGLGRERIYLIYIFIMALSAVLVGVAILLCYMARRDPKKWKKITGLSLRSVILYLGFHSINLLVFGGMIVFIFNGGSITEIMKLGGFYLIAWVIGMVVPGAPGGIGIREYILLIFLRDMMDKSYILQIAVLMRIITLSGDILAAGIGGFLHRIDKKRYDHYTCA